jgi:hypothetical protein
MNIRYSRNHAIKAHEDAEQIINQLRANKVVKHLVEWSESKCKNYIVVKLNEENKETTY